MAEPAAATLGKAFGMPVLDWPEAACVVRAANNAEPHAQLGAERTSTGGVRHCHWQGQEWRCLLLMLWILAPKVCFFLPRVELDEI